MDNRKIYDCFIFYNELELLRIRFDELYEVVDYFVICEATVTFQGKKKPLFFEQSKQEFRQYADKIIHVIVDDMPEDVSSTNSDASGAAGVGLEKQFWSREHHQRNAIRRGLAGAAPKDVICISDCDEIINRNTIRIFRESEGYFLLDMSMYQFFLNMCAQTAGWRKVFAYSYALDKEVGDFNFVRTHEVQTYEKFAGLNHRLDHAGWHFTFLGGAQQVKDKLAAYSHASDWQRQMRNETVLSDQLLALREVGGTKVLRFHSIDDTFPSRVQREQQRYFEMGLAKDALTRLRELEVLWSATDSRFKFCSRLYAISLQLLDHARQALIARQIRVAALVNLIPSSQTFRIGWNGGMQSERAGHSDAVSAPMMGSRLMRHVRDPEAVTRDSNVGYFSSLPVVPNRKYAASCFVWIPQDFAGQRVDLNLDDWPMQRRSTPGFEIRGRWQRIECFGTAPSSVMGCNVILRIQSSKRCSLYSACWQLEEGDTATDYLGTDLEALGLS